MTRRRARRLATVTFTAAAAVYAAATVQAARAADWQPASPRDQRTAAQVSEWLTRNGFNVKPDPMWVTDSIPNYYYPGETVEAAATSRGPLLIRAVTTGPDARYTVSMTLIHEYLHSLREPAEYATLTPAERHVEEGAVTAVTEDLAPRFWCAVWGDCSPGGTMVFAEANWSYARWAAMVRGVSGRATRSRWSTQRARAWRYQLVRANRDERAAMWAQATGVTR